MTTQELIKPVSQTPSIPGSQKLANPKFFTSDKMPNSKYQYFFELISDVQRFKECKSFREQVEYILEVAKQLNIKNPTGADIARFFFNDEKFEQIVNKQSVYDQINAINKKTPGESGRRPILNEQLMNQVLDKVRELYDKGSATTYPQLKEIMVNLAKRDIKMNTVRKITYNNVEFGHSTATPMDRDRAGVEDDDLILHYLQLALALNGIPSMFVYNCDEMGYSEKADKSSKRCVVPIENVDSDLYVRVNNSSKHYSLLACIDLAGGCLKPMIATKQKTKDSDLSKWGYGSERVILAHSEKGYFNTELFEQWIEDIFIEDVKQKRIKYGYSGKAVLVLDGFSGHESEKIRVLLSENNVEMHYILPHSSHITQPLDVGIFAVLKGKMGDANLSEDLSEQTEAVIKIVDALNATAKYFNVIKAFNSTGINTIQVGNVSYASVDPEKASKFDIENVFRGVVFHTMELEGDLKKNKLPLSDSVVRHIDRIEFFKRKDTEILEAYWRGVKTAREQKQKELKEEEKRRKQQEKAQKISRQRERQKQHREHRTVHQSRESNAQFNQQLLDMFNTGIGDETRRQSQNIQHPRMRFQETEQNEYHNQFRDQRDDEGERITRDMSVFRHPFAPEEF